MGNHVHEYTADYATGHVLVTSMVHPSSHITPWPHAKMRHMGNPSETIANARTRRERSSIRHEGPAEGRPSGGNLELQAATERLDQARERFFSAAIAFCEGSISAGQLRAVRELLREREQRLAELSGSKTPPFIDEPPHASPLTDTELATLAPVTDEVVEDFIIPDKAPPDIKRRLTTLNVKIARLERDFQQGRINASQYQAVRRHYLEQRDVVLRICEKHPESDRWKIVLEEGKTTYLMQLNEAICHCVGIYEVKSRDRIFCHGEMPTAAEEAMALLRTFGTPEPNAASGRMFATQIEDGSALLLIPGEFTLCLAVFSQPPPAWQVRALREVHRHFEAANKVTLERAERRTLLFPDLSRFIKT
jgi:hypothetical protein